MEWLQRRFQCNRAYTRLTLTYHCSRTAASHDVGDLNVFALSFRYDYDQEHSHVSCTYNLEIDITMDCNHKFNARHRYDLKHSSIIDTTTSLDSDLFRLNA